MTPTRIPGLVSIVVASYNHARFLPRRMESLIAQTYEHIEILVIDDCSTDRSAEVLQQYASHPKVTVTVRERNGGWVEVSNQGVDMTKGEFVIFANCDDDCDPRMVERLVSGMREHTSVGITFCRSLFVDEEDRVIGDDFAGREHAFRIRCATDTLLTGAELSRFLLNSCVIPNLSAALIRRECFAKVGQLSDSYRVVCDWDLFFRIFAQYDGFYVAEPLNRFRQHATTIRSRTKLRIVYGEYIRLLLPRVIALDLTPRARARRRTQVMSIWAGHLIAPSLSGLRNFGFHVKLVWRYDPLALLFLPLALARRAIDVVGKVFGGHSSAGESPSL